LPVLGCKANKLHACCEFSISQSIDHVPAHVTVATAR